MPRKAVGPSQPTDPAEYLRNKTFRDCRRGHRLPFDKVKWRTADDDPDADVEQVLTCERGCGYEVRKRGIILPNGDIQRRPRRTRYENKDYLVQGGVRINPWHADEFEIRQVWERKTASAARRKPLRKAVPKAAGRLASDSRRDRRAS